MLTNDLEQYLIRNGESANRLAKRAGVSQPLISQLMTMWGKPYRITAISAYKLSRATGIPMETFANQPVYNKGDSPVNRKD